MRKNPMIRALNDAGLFLTVIALCGLILEMMK